MASARPVNSEPAGPVRTLFALSNWAHWITRVPDEGEPLTASTYLNFFSTKLAAAVRRGRLWISEAGQTVVDVTNGKIFQGLLVGEPPDVRMAN